MEASTKPVCSLPGTYLDVELGIGEQVLPSAVPTYLCGSQTHPGLCSLLQWKNASSAEYIWEYVSHFRL